MSGRKSDEAATTGGTLFGTHAQRAIFPSGADRAPATAPAGPAPHGDELERLRARVAELEDLLGLTARNRGWDLPLRTPAHRQVVRLCALLLKREFWSGEGLHVALYGDRPDGDQPALKMIGVLVHHARKGLRPIDVEIRTRYGEGYYMPAASKKRLHAFIVEQEAAAHGAPVPSTSRVSAAADRGDRRGRTTNVA